MGTVGVAPGTTTVKLPDGRVVALTDWIDDKFYGTVEMQNGDARAILAFSTGLSQTIPGGSRPSTEVDTNIPRNGDSGLPQDWEFLCYGWGIKFVRATRPTAPATQVADLSTFSDPVSFRTWFEIDRRTFFKYRYNRKDYTEGVIQDYPQGHGLFLTTTQTQTEYVNNGFPSPRDRLALVLPVHHKMNLSFAGYFVPMIPEVIAQPATDQGAGGADLTVVDVKLYAYGLIRRTVV
jgi:hypothetical protein